MILRLLPLLAFLPAALTAGVLTLNDGQSIEGVFNYQPDAGLVLKTANGAVHAAKPGTFKSLSIAANDAIWPEHLRAADTDEIGLLGQYFEGTEFKGKARVRIDPGLAFRWGAGSPFPDWRHDRFSVRWTCHFQVPESGEYEFFIHSDDGVRLFIDGKQLVTNWSDHSVTENKIKLRFDVAELYQLRVDYYEGTGDAELRVEWAGPDGKRHPLSELILIAAAAEPSGSELVPLTKIGLRPGLVLRDGTVLTEKIRRANDTAFEVGDRRISTFNVARAVFREIPPALAASTRPGRQGALLVGGDFVDSEFKSLDNGILNLSSLLFGIQKLDTKYETHALLLRAPRADQPRWRVRDRSGSTYLAETLRFTVDGLVISNTILSELALPIDTLVEIKAGTPAELFPALLSFGPDSIHSQSRDTRNTGDAEHRRIDSLKRMAAKEKSRRERENSDQARKAREEQQALEEARRKLAEATAKHETADRNFDRARTDHQAKERTYNELNDQRAKLQNEYNQLNRDYSRLLSEIRKLDSHQKRETQRARTIERNLKNSSIKKDERKLTAARKELDQVRARQQKLQSDRTKLEQQYNEVRKQKTDKDRALASNKGGLAKAKSARDQAKRSMDNAQRQLRSAESALKQSRDKLTIAEAKVQARQRTQLR